MLEQKEPKIQGKSPTSIYPAKTFRNEGSHRIAKASRTITNACDSLENIIMSFYDLSKDKRAALVDEIKAAILSEIKPFDSAQGDRLSKTIEFFSDEDTYIRKAAYPLEEFI